MMNHLMGHSLWVRHISRTLTHLDAGHRLGQSGKDHRRYQLDVVLIRRLEDEFRSKTEWVYAAKRKGDLQYVKADVPSFTKTPEA
jgi:hypothetical protein